MATFAIDTFANQEMDCPPDWENGYKEGRIERVGIAERSLSSIWDGTWTGAQFEIEYSDSDARFRRQHASPIDRFWIETTAKMTTRANRAIKGEPYTVFHGPVVDAQPLPDRRFKKVLGDVISRALISDQGQIPWRKIRDCGLMVGLINQAATIITSTTAGTFAISDKLDLDRPEPRIYGIHRRTHADPQSPQGFEWTPIYLGIWTIAGTSRHTWMVGGHACATLLDANAIDSDGVYTTLMSDPDWVIPGGGAFSGLFGADKYVDIRSHTYGVDRRYSLILAEVGNAHADACASGEETLTCFVEGVEPNGDGSGAVITDFYQQAKHVYINDIANPAALSYQSGAWLTTPSWDVFGVSVPMIDEASFDACTAIGVERLPEVEGADYPAGLNGAFILGASDQVSTKAMVADLNRSGAMRTGPTRLGQWRAVLLHPTDEIKAAAQLYTDTFDILDGSFSTELLWADQANRVFFKGDLDHRTGTQRTSGVADDQEAIQNYDREMPSEEREYPCIPGITMLYHVARLEMLIRRHPPRLVGLADAILEPTPDSSLGYKELGDYIRYRSFDAVANADGEERLAQIVKLQVDPESLQCRALAIDCEDLIGYDVLEPSPVVSNETCETATEITQEPFTPVAIHQDTSAHATDTSVEGLFPGPGIAYHAAWFTFTPWADGTLFLTTVHSEYDTQMAVFSGDCGDLTLEQYNDNDVYNNRTSVLEFPVTMGVPLKILVAGYGPEDGGPLTLGLYFTEPEIP